MFVVFFCFCCSPTWLTSSRSSVITWIVPFVKIADYYSNVGIKTTNHFASFPFSLFFQHWHNSMGIIQLSTPKTWSTSSHSFRTWIGRFVKIADSYFNVGITQTCTFASSLCSVVCISLFNIDITAYTLEITQLSIPLHDLIHIIALLQDVDQPLLQDWVVSFFLTCLVSFLIHIYIYI